MVCVDLKNSNRFSYSRKQTPLLFNVRFWPKADTDHSVQNKKHA